MAAGILLPPQRKEIVCARGWKLFLPSYCARCGGVETNNRKHGEIRGNLTWPEQRECQHRRIA